MTHTNLDPTSETTRLNPHLPADEMSPEIRTLQQTNFLLGTMTRVQDHFIAGLDQWTLWDQFVQDILVLTQSEYGYIGEVLYHPNGDPYLVFRGLTNIAWSESTRALFEQLQTQGLAFHRLDTLFGAGLRNGGQPIIANQPETDPRRGGLPSGHPPLNAFMALPVYGKNGLLIGQMGLANRPNGYNAELELYLKPLLVTCGYILEAYRNQAEHQQMAKDLAEQNQLIQTIMDNASTALFMMDAEGRCAYMNAAAEKLTGYTLNEARYQTLHSLIHYQHPGEQHYASQDYLWLKALQEKRKIRGHEELFVRKDGTFFHAVCSAEPILRDGQPVGTVIDVRDITQEKQAQQALRESEMQFRLMADSVPVLIWRSDTDQQCDYFNQQWLAYRGRTLTQEVGNGWQEGIHPQDLPRCLDVYRCSFESRQSFELEYRLRKANGEYGWMLARGIPRFSVEGVFLGYIGSCLEVTERREARAELERLVSLRTRELQAINQELEAFCSSVSHDLRAPLRGIGGFTQAVLDDYAQQLEPTGLTYLKRVQEETWHMEQLIQDMLKLSRVTRVDIKQETVDLSALAKEITGNLQAQNPHRHVEVTVQPGMLAWGDAHLLHNALYNLLDNSWKFTSNKQVAQVEFAQIHQDGQPVYFIRDNGAGFDMSYAGKLFGAFQRLHTMEEFPGTGIGLATVQRIIRRHGGRVWAEGYPMQGATFFFTLHNTSSPAHPSISTR